MARRRKKSVLKHSGSLVSRKKFLVQDDFSKTISIKSSVLPKQIKTSTIWLNFSPTMRRYWKKAEHKKAKIGWALLVLVIPFVFFLTVVQSSSDENQLVTPQDITQQCVWKICAIDTMKTSRDMAGMNLHNLSYDADIKAQLQAIRESGATHVSITTPYDDEFLPYLKRWVNLSREEGLKVWFRGNWSSWEGWFGYPKNMTPEQHLEKNSQFIATHSDLFQNGDIFDPCPECENAYFWPQNDKNADYQQFIQKQQMQTEADFAKIQKQITVHQSIIGGRAKDVLDQETFDALHNVIAIDHYVPKKEGMSEYIDYFQKLNTKSLVSEFGAPIPDMNGNLDEKKQAEFVKSILEILYQKRDSVEGLNYWVLSHGTTALLNPDYSKRPVYDVVKSYFSPAVVEGRVINPLGEGIQDINIQTSTQVHLATTDENGYYRFPLPPRKIDLVIDNPDYSSHSARLEATESGQIIIHDAILEPTKPGIIYNLKLFWQNLTH